MRAQALSPQLDPATERSMIARLTQHVEAKRQAIEKRLFGRLNGRLNDADLACIDGAFHQLQNQFLHGPITAVTADPYSEGHTLLEALRRLFWLQD
jgi:hypothetical protein